MQSFIARILHDQNGATAVEYGLLIALLALAALGAIKGVADENTTMWAYVKEEITTATD